MWLDLSFRRRSLKARLILSYLLILAVGGLVTSIVGSWIVSSTIMRQAHRSVDHDLATARTIYDQQLRTLERTVHLSASGTTIPQFLSTADRTSLFAYLDWMRKDTGFDFLTLTDSSGRAILRVSQPNRTGDDVSTIPVVRAALSGRLAAATEILSAQLLDNEGPQLRARAYFHIVPTPKAKPIDKTEETSGMVLIAAAPVRGAAGRILGVLYGGVLLNRNFAIVDRVFELVFKGERFENQDVGSVTVFQNDLRISTNVKTAAGERALGTRVSEEVYDAVLGRGEGWRSSAFVVRDWYISAYDPVRNYDGRIIGILYVGLLEKAYTSIRDRVILSFFGIATLGFILIAAITYYEIRSMTLPIARMLAATRNITAGRFDQEVESSSEGEIAELAASFNIMLKSLRQMRADLEEWGRTLEEKVRERSEELVAMHNRVAQSERLASLGLLAAGVAHEVNNPLGGILSLTALTLEDMRPDDPNRENLAEVLKQTERCRDIVRSLLEFSRQSAVSTELVDLNKILQDTLSLVAKQAQFFNINVVKDWAAQLPPVVADKSQLQQVFINILMNAAQALAERGTVTIVTRHNPSDNHVEVLISDTGAGIPPEKIDRIFDPFFTTKASGHGTGLGLSIAYGIVQRYNGTISVESQVGKGSTFTIRLPAASPGRQDTPT
jgi:two-component system NtrC family sensor kinase